MPEEYKDMKRMIYCNDCGQTNEVNYHFVYNKVVIVKYSYL